MGRDPITVPAREARTFRVRAGETFRIVAHEGPQVGDAVFVGDGGDRTYCSDMTAMLNQLRGTGDLRRVETLYSRPPEMRPMATVTADTMGHHFPWAGGMCCSLLYEIRDGDPDHANCADALHEVLRAAGYDRPEVPEVFNVGMNVRVEDDEVRYADPEYGAGDYIELRPETALLVALSACPNDTDVINDGEPKPLRVAFPDELS